MVRVTLAGVLIAATAIAAPVPKDFRKPPTRLDGSKWKVTAYESNGRPVNSTIILNQTWAFDGENLTVTRPAVGKGATPAPTKLKFRADPKKRPMEFDYILATGTVRPGLFALDGDTLTVCLTINTTTGERPLNLDGGTGTLKYTLTRVKDKQPTEGRPMTPLLLAPPLVVAAPVPKEVKKEPPLEGKWQVTAYEIDGRAGVGTPRMTWTFAGEELLVGRDGGVNELPPLKVKVRTDAKTTPMAFDYTAAGGKTLPGVFAVDGEMLTVCLTIAPRSTERPRTLDGGAGIAKYTLKRVGKDK